MPANSISGMPAVYRVNGLSYISNCEGFLLSKYFLCLISSIVRHLIFLFYLYIIR